MTKWPMCTGFVSLPQHGSKGASRDSGLVLWQHCCHKEQYNPCLVLASTRLAQRGGQDAELFPIFGDRAACHGNAPRVEQIGQLLIAL